jgi:SSS family solute:Na+ symporter
MAARSMFPMLADPQQALPAVLMNALPPLIGALGIAAVFSAEISAADAVLMILTTSFAEDLYRRFYAPAADDQRMLRVARWTTLVSAVLGLALAIVAESILAVITIFYTLVTVSLFVPIVAGLFVPRTTTVAAKRSIAAGVGGALVMQIATNGRGWGMITPALAGLALAVAAWSVSLTRGASDDVSDRGHRR